MNFWPFKKKQETTAATHVPKKRSRLLIKLHTGDELKCESSAEEAKGQVWKDFFDWYEAAGSASTYVLLRPNGAIGVRRGDIRYIFVDELFD